MGPAGRVHTPIPARSLAQCGGVCWDPHSPRDTPVSWTRPWKLAGDRVQRPAAGQEAQEASGVSPGPTAPHHPARSQARPCARNHRDGSRPVRPPPTPGPAPPPRALTSAPSTPTRASRVPIKGRRARGPAGRPGARGPGAGRGAGGAAPSDLPTRRWQPPRSGSRARGWASWEWHGRVPGEARPPDPRPPTRAPHPLPRTALPCALPCARSPLAPQPTLTPASWRWDPNEMASGYLPAGPGEVQYPVEGTAPHGVPGPLQRGRGERPAGPTWVVFGKGMGFLYWKVPGIYTSDYFFYLFWFWGHTQGFLLVLGS